MKKIFSLILVVLTVFSLTSCFNKTEEKLWKPEVCFDDSELSDFYFKLKIVETRTDEDGNEKTEERTLILSETDHGTASCKSYSYETGKNLFKTSLTITNFETNKEETYTSDKKTPTSLTKENEPDSYFSNTTVETDSNGNFIIVKDGETNQIEIVGDVEGLGNSNSSNGNTAIVVNTSLPDSKLPLYTGINLEYYMSILGLHLTKCDDEGDCYVYDMSHPSQTEYKLYIDKETGLVKKNVSTQTVDGETITTVMTIEDYSLTEHCIPEFELIDNTANSEETAAIKDEESNTVENDDR